jgi:hypothetical protein
VEAKTRVPKTKTSRWLGLEPSSELVKHTEHESITSIDAQKDDLGIVSFTLPEFTLDAFFGITFP